MRKFLIRAFITVSVILAATFGPNEDRKIDEQTNIKNTSNDDLVVEDILIDNFQFVNIEEVKSSSSGLIRMSQTNANDTESIPIEESKDVTESELQLEDYIEGEIMDQLSTVLSSTK